MKKFGLGSSKELFWGYLASLLNVGYGLILLPLVLTYLSKKEVGLWFVFITLGSLSQLFEFGVQPTLSRYVTYAYAGASKLGVGVIPVSNKNYEQANYALLSDLLYISKQTYKKITLILSFFTFGLCSIYISTFSNGIRESTEYIFSWIIFASGLSINFYYGYFNGFLFGRGDITLANKAVVFTRTTFMIVGSILLFFKFGIFSISLASLLSSIVGRVISYSYFTRRSLSSIDPVTKSQFPLNSTLHKDLWKSSSQLGLVQLGGFLVQRGNIFIASSLFGLTVSASYSLTVSVFLVLSGISTMYCMLKLPLMNRLQMISDKSYLKKLFTKVLLTALFIYIAGSMVILTFGEKILDLIGSNTRFLPLSVCLILALIYLLELNHSISSLYLTTKNNIPFLKASLLSGLFIILLGGGLAFLLGPLGLILAQGIVQLFYNNWKWPYEAYKDLGYSFFHFTKVKNSN
jgi:O-antigen/teichoic acid export membrane protein